MKHYVFTDEFKMNSYIRNKRKFHICDDRSLKTYYVPCPYHNRDNKRHIVDVFHSDVLHSIYAERSDHEMSL
jgi:hypothetical protein